MGAIFEVVVEFFQKDNWKFYQLEEETTLRLDMSGEHGEWRCYAEVDEESGYFYFYSHCPVKAPEDKRVALADFLTRANYGLRLGNFELDFRDGEIRYKTSIRVKGERLTPLLVKHLVYANVKMMDEYLPGIMSVIYGGVSPEKAMAQIEQEEPESDLN